MFWKLTFRQPSAIDTLLNEETCSLHDILDEDNVLQELKSQNKKLVDFFVRPDILEQLVKLVTLEPEENVEDKVKFKYPHLACELLTCEVEAIITSLSGSEHLMGLLWAFLDKQEPLNPLVGSFISKVLAMLLCQRATVIFNYARDKEGFILSFLNHLGTSAMMDLLIQMVAAPDTDQCRVDLAWWLKEQAIVEKLVDFIHPSADPEQCANASQTLCDMIRLSREAAQMAGPTPLLSTLESDLTMKRLLDNMFSSEIASDVVIVSGVSVLLTAIERRQPNVLSPALNPSLTTEEVSQNNAEAIDNALGVIIPRMKDFHNLLIKPPDVPPMLTTVGILDPPLGNTRLQVVKLFCALLQCNDARVNREIAALQTFSTLMDLFFKFPWNNFLHTQVEGCISAGLSSTASLNANENGSEEPFSMKYHILHDCQLIHRLLQGEEENQRCSSKPGGNRQGHMGHLIKIVNHIVTCGENDQNLGQILKDVMEEDVQKKWNEFVGGTVAETNRRNETNLGGNRPMTSSMDDSDDEFDQLAPPDNELDKAYQHYQEVKYISAFMDDFGVDDQLRTNEEPYSGTFSQLMDIACVTVAEEEQSQTAALFEAACNEKIQQFDDSESDEEESSTWADREVTFTSPLDRQSMSSDEDESSNRQREFQTSFEDDNPNSSQRTALYMTTSPGTLSQVTGKSNGGSDKMDISSHFTTAISWRTDFNHEDLSGVTPMDTAAGVADWTNEPIATTPPSPRSDWADFSSFGPDSGQEIQKSTAHDTNLDNSIEHLEKMQGEENESEAQSPPRHDTAQYSVLSPQKEDSKPKEDCVSLDVESVEFTVMDDACSPGRPHVASHSAKDASSSDEEGTDSEEERSGKYELNTSSDGEYLLQSPAQSPAQSPQQQPNPNDRRDHFVPAEVGSSPMQANRHQLSSNGMEVPHKQVVPGAVENSTKNEQAVYKDKETTGRSNYHEHLNAERGEAELAENFDFLEQQGLLHGAATTDQKLTKDQIEIKREEAMEACKQYDQEVQGSQGIDMS